MLFFINFEFGLFVPVDNLDSLLLPVNFDLYSVLKAMNNEDVTSKTYMFTLLNSHLLSVWQWSCHCLFLQCISKFPHTRQTL